MLVMAVTETGFSPALLADAAKSLAQRLPVGFCLPVNGEPAQHAASLPATSALVDD